MISTTEGEIWQAVPAFHTSATSRSMTAVAQAHMNMCNRAQASAWSNGDDVKREAKEEEAKKKNNSLPDSLGHSASINTQQRRQIQPLLGWLSVGSRPQRA